MLNKILETKRKEIEALVLPEQVIVEKRSLYEAFAHTKRSIGLLAEVKKASPSKGLIREDFHPVEIAKGYEKGGADAISVLTDETYFQGHTSYLTAIKGQVHLPVLRKDFIIDERQVEQSARIGADAILLIVGTVPIKKLHTLYSLAHEIGLECLVEVHSEEELKELIEHFTPTLLGINNRNLSTFETNLSQTEAMSKLVREDQLFLSESGIHHPEDVNRVKKANASGILVGESLMRAESPEAGINYLFGGEPVHARS